MKRKRILTFALAWALLAVSLTGCGGQSAGTDTQGQSADSAQTAQEDAGGALIENDGMEEDYQDAPSITQEDIDARAEENPFEETADPYEGLSEEDAKQVQTVLALVNQERAAAGLYPLTLDASLMKAAKVRAQECVQLFSHTRPNNTPYKTAIQEAGVECTAMGENVATGFDTAEKAMNGWMNSEGHKANILRDKFSRIGIGLAPNTGNKYTGYAWTQEFAN